MVDVSERLDVLLTQEECIYKTSDYLARLTRARETEELKEKDAKLFEEEAFSTPISKKRKCLSGKVLDCSFDDDSSSSDQLSMLWREKICQWAYEVSNHYGLSREVVSITMNYLDRYLAVFPKPVDNKLFQLSALTCLYLAIKLYEYKIVPMTTMLKLSRGFFTLEQMKEMECDILSRLQWHLHPATPRVFVSHLLFLLSNYDQDVYCLAVYMVELSALDYFFVTYKASEVAAAAIMNAVEITLPGSEQHFKFPFQNPLFDFQSANIRKCRERLRLLYSYASEEECDAQFTTHPEKESHHIPPSSPTSVLAGPQPSIGVSNSW